MWNNFEQELRLLREANANHPVIAAHEEAVRNLRATFEAKKKQWLAEPNSGDRSVSKLSVGEPFFLLLTYISICSTLVATSKEEMREATRTMKALLVRYPNSQKMSVQG